MEEHVWSRTPSDEERALAAEIVESVARTLVQTADPVWAGWGERQKFPHPDALHFLLVRGAETRDPELLDLALKTLRLSQRAEIHDAVEGGFYRFATQRDWSVPNTEKPLRSNAKRLLAITEAYQVLGGEDLERTALDTAAWLRATLLDPETGAFRASQDADPVYARLQTREERAERGAPPIDPTVHADRNAWAAVAFLKAGFVFGNGSLTETGLGALDFVLTRLFHPRRGVHHYWNGSPNQPGDLVDQAATLRAIVEAAHSGGTNRYLDVGVQIAEWADEHLTAGDRSFRGDRHQTDLSAAERSAGDLGANALMAEALVRLAILTGRPRWAARGRAALMAFRNAWRPHGFATAGYGRALQLIAKEPLHVIVVGADGDPRTAELFEAARRAYVSSRVAQRVDPARETALAAALGVTPSDENAPPYALLAGPGAPETLRIDRPEELHDALASGLDQGNRPDGR